MTATTDLQIKMILAIAEDELAPCNGAEPDNREDATTWADCVIDNATDRGVVRSLVNAGLVYHEGKGRDAVVGLTEEGFKVYKAHKNETR